MEILVLFSLIVFGCYVEADVTFDISNAAGGPLWIGIQGITGSEALNGGGFVLDQGQTTSVQAPDTWGGRFWARTYCDPNTNHCLTGDCGNKLECQGAGGAPPVSLIEINLKGNAGKDTYDVSLVDGFNVQLSIEPVHGQQVPDVPPEYSCTKDACQVDVNSGCPAELQVKNDQGTVIACNSACNAFGTDEYCCAGEFNDPEKCKAGNYAQYFKDKCPDAYSYAFDDHKSTFICIAQHYKIQFGP